MAGHLGRIRGNFEFLGDRGRLYRRVQRKAALRSCLAVFAIARALARATGRNLASYASIKVNNFFLFVALLIYGALESGVRPASSYPFLLLLGFLLLFPLSSDLLDKIPRDRLASWPLAPAERLALRLVAVGVSPILWVALAILWRTSGTLALSFLGAAAAIQGAIVAGSRVTRRAPRWNPWRHVPQFPGPVGGLVRKNVRQMLSVLDLYVAVLLSASGAAYRFLYPGADPAAYPILSWLIGVALSTYAQSLFGLDSDSGATRDALLPLRGWQILLAKDVAYLAILLVLALPLSIGPALTFGLIALAVGHFASVHLRLPQRRWRFTSGRVAYGVAQMISGGVLGFAESQQGVVWLAIAAAACGVSLYGCGRAMRPRQ